MKKWIGFACAVLLAGVLVFAGALFLKSRKEETGGTQTLIYYTIGKEDEDLEKVNGVLNKKLEKEYGISVDYRKMDWNVYGDRLTDFINLHEPMDIAFAAGTNQGNYVENARKGAWYPLDDFLKGEGAALYEAVPEILWESAKVDGHIYGVPTSKELAVPEQWMYAAELVDKYEIDIDQIQSLEDLEPYFARIRANEPEYTVMELNKFSNNFFAMEGYEYLLDYGIPLMVNSMDEEVKVVNILETELGERTLKTLRRYYLAGYINKDAPIRDSEVLQKGEKVFWRQASGGPYSEVGWSEERGYKVYARMMTSPVINNVSVQGAYMCVSSNSDHPEESMKFLEAVNTDKEVRNILQYGIQGDHYRLDNQGQAVILKDTYTGARHTQGNYFLLYSQDGEPEDIWDKYREMNESAVASEVLNFKPDLSELGEEIEAVRLVTDQYYPAVMTGSVDIKKYLPEYKKALKKAGIEKIRKELQKQLSQWKANENTQERE